MREPLLVPSAGLCAGILAAGAARFSLEEAAGAAGALFLLAAVARRRWVAWAAFVPLGIAAAVWQQPEAAPELDAGPGETVILSGCVVEPSLFAEGREQFTLELAPGARARVSLYPRPGETPPALRYGERVEVEGKARTPRNFGNPGAFDYARYLARRGVYWTVSTRTGAGVTRLEGRCGSAAAGALFALRGEILRRLELFYPGDNYHAWMMQALLIGENTRLEKAWTEEFRRTGTYHALVISGIHVTLVAGLLLTVVRRLSGQQTASLLLAVGVAWIYALLAGMTAPVLRAAAGFTLFGVCRFWHREPRVLNLLAAVGLAVLLADPEQMGEASFQLSFLSVLAIAGLADPFYERVTAPVRRGVRQLEDWRLDLRKPFGVAALRVELRLAAATVAAVTGVRAEWVCRALAGAVAGGVWVFEMVFLSALMQVALALPMALYFHRASLSGVLANLAVVPLMNIAVVVGFAAVALSSATLAAGAAWFLDGGRYVAAVAARGVLFAASLVALAVAARRGGRWRSAAAALVLGLFLILVVHPFAPGREAGVLEVAAIDVGQGDSLLVVSPEGRMAVIDGGGIPQFPGRPKPRLDIGEDVVSSYLWTRSIRRLDAVALTHAHEDHAGGVDALLENFRPRELWVGAMGESATWRRIREHAGRLGIRIVARRAGEHFDFGGAAVTVLAPFADQTPAEPPHNNDSLVLRLAFGRRSLLLTGDLEKEMEARILGEEELEPVDVLKLGHHGSRSSTTDAWLERLHPALALASAGQDNLYHHPHPEVVRRLAERRIGLLRTDQYGMVRVLTDGARLWVERRPWRDDRRPLLPAF